MAQPLDPQTRQQLLEISRRFYEAQAEAFDASRGHQPWPGWDRLLRVLPKLRFGEPRPVLRVLDVGCGNARFARFLDESGYALDYVGLDENAALLEAAGERLRHREIAGVELVEHDFLASPLPGSEMPGGPFDLVVLMGILHHVPGADWRRALLEACTERLRPGGHLALATWQFGENPRFDRRRVDWASVGEVLGATIATEELEPGDTLLRFGDTPSQPPRYCHQVADAEFQSWPGDLELRPALEYFADGSGNDLNHYWVLRRPEE